MDQFFFFFRWRDVRKPVDAFGDFVWFLVTNEGSFFFLGGGAVLNRFCRPAPCQVKVFFKNFFAEFGERKRQKTLYGGGNLFRFMCNN